MSIPESQLETWSHQGSVTQSSDTYKAIKNTLETSGSPYATKTYEVFLQGSYGNNTNIYAESDVDIVIVLKDAFLNDLKQLSDSQRAGFDAAYPNAAYTHSHFKRDVLAVLTRAYGADVTAG